MPSPYLTARLRSVGHALRGLGILLQSQQNARIHAAASILVVAAGAVFRISPAEWALIVTAILCVWVAEAINTAIEFLVDLASPELHPLAGKAKDVAAGAVLAAAVGAAVIGGLVFGPHLVGMMLES
ncbi:MAG: diacylglycerol kinase family protein [Burkholderiales bacterium]|nr:diacylglycerol kinase family protein [Burkholderiales bacterium]